MRKYETVFISDPDLQDKARAELFDKVRNIISNEKGLILNFDEWGNKKLAYEIKKKFRGHYVCVTYGGTGELVKELERNFRLSDAVLKFMTILLSDDMTLEQLKSEVQDTQEEPQPAEAPEESKEDAVEEETDAEDTSDNDEEVEETQEETS